VGSVTLAMLVGSCLKERFKPLPSILRSHAEL
jgi:hypothetical protein